LSELHEAVEPPASEGAFDIGGTHVGKRLEMVVQSRRTHVRFPDDKLRLQSGVDEALAGDVG
jgi:hypothetical protein